MPDIISYEHVPKGYISLYEAASLLAFGDRDYLKHYTERYYTKKDCPDLENLRRSKDSCPEIDAAVERIIGERTKILARHRAVGEWIHKEHPPINDRYEPVPESFLEFNDWWFGWWPPFAITPKGGSEYRAEWFCPAISERDLDKLRGGTTRRRGVAELPFWPDAREATMKWLDDGGCPETLAEIERFIAGWLSDNDHEAGEATIRRHATKYKDEFRAQRLEGS